ncbi:uncharacterized protein MAM_01788 [Metarhizium album ARSEF 1941]|uniref:Uncharacterized protein n=1 Tax=Metarhizium album (strain ARSEF 1941) TaxID=1081103 RepID=A0A0B2X372_METAS|nr:uncharacterized protein MAM_01788 [Metarhizium album ARSEF 1941]KHN99864.1 hypothetical protein MAM_01788 [Metarhizium album ARSEF 1941]
MAVVSPPDQASLLSAVLPALPAAAASTQPALQVLPLLSPILRQRVQLLSASSTEPWLRLLCYDAAKAAKLADIARGPTLEPHPVSGEVEVDWGYDSETRYRRLDQETLQALVALPELGLAFNLVYCVNDKEGGGDGWRIGEVTVADKPTPFSQFGGASTIAEAERQFNDKEAKETKARDTLRVNGATAKSTPAGDVDDDDDDYWARYDATPARTPASHRSPAPNTGSATLSHHRQPDALRSVAEDDYFAQYDGVQPAMDNHDPDEEAQAARLTGSPGCFQQNPAPAWVNGNGGIQHGLSNAEIGLQQPRPESSASSNGSLTVAKLEETAGRQEKNEFGVKQHVSRSIRSLYMLSKASGIDRDEFERLVKTELDLLGMMDEGE